MAMVAMTGGRGGDHQMLLQGRTGGLLDLTTPRAEFLLMDDLIFPGGFRFHPFDEELLVGYLGKKVAGETLPFGLDDVIPTIPCFYGPDGGGDPRCLFQRLPLAARRQRLVQRADEFYIFTRWEHCNAGGRPTRVAGPGTWNFNHDRAVVDEWGRTLGRVGHLTFLLRGDKVDGGGRKRGKGATTHWVMHEYRLPDEEQGDEADGGGRSRASGAKKGRRAAQQQQPREGRLVLCRMRNTQKDNNNGGGRALDVDEGDINLADGGDPPLLRPRKQKRGGPAPEEEGEKEEPPQHPAVACNTLGIPLHPPDDHRVRTDDAAICSPGETCLATVDHDVMVPLTPQTAPPAMPLYDGEAPVQQQLACPPLVADVIPAGRWPVDLADQMDHGCGVGAPHNQLDVLQTDYYYRGIPGAPPAFMPHYDTGENPDDQPQFMPPAPVVEVQEPILGIGRLGPGSTGGEGGGGLCAGADLGMWMDEDVDGDWWTQLGDLLHGGDATTIAETCVTGDDDNHMYVPPTAPAAAAAPMPLMIDDGPAAAADADGQILCNGGGGGLHRATPAVDVVDITDGNIVPPLLDLEAALLREFWWSP